MINILVKTKAVFNYTHFELIILNILTENVNVNNKLDFNKPGMVCL